MPEIPLPFLVSGILLLVLVRLCQRRIRQTWFLLFVGICAVQSALVGLRWSVGADWVGGVQPVLAACLPPIALASFETLRDGRVSPMHGLWPIAVMLSWWLLPIAVDPLLIAEFALYGLMILQLRFSDDMLTHVRIGDAWAVSHARVGVAALLMLSALVDVIVAIDLASGDGTVAAPAIAAMGVVLVGLSGVLLARAGDTIPADTGEAAPQGLPGAPLENEEEQAILETVEALLAEGLYRDYDLTLRRLSRRARIPARKISQAVNRIQGRSVTDLVNAYRVCEAMRLLREGTLPVTQIMLEAGFQTKSNFNRAFREIAGRTPSDYRRSGTG